MPPLTKVDLTLKPAEVTFANDTFMDGVGRVFFWKDRVFRAVYPESRFYVDLLFSSGVVGALTEKRLLVGTERTSLALEGFAQVLEHTRADFFVQPIHYTREMARRAALNWIDANIALDKHRLGYIDGHYLNIAQVIDGNPVQIDFGSILPLRSEDMGLAQLIKCHVNPLLILQKCREGDLFRASLQHHGPTQGEIKALYGTALEFGGGARAKFLHEARDLVTSMHIGLPQRTQWTSYYGMDPEEFVRQPGVPVERIPDLRLRLTAIETILARHSCRTLIDIGGNTGYFSLPFAKRGMSVLVADTDEPALDKLLAGLWTHSPGWKVATALASAIIMDAPYRADCALALALTHHLAITRGYKFEMIFSRLAQFTNDVLITEFMPDGMGNRVPRPNPLPAGYTLENCLKVLQGLFDHVEVVPVDMPAERPLRTMIYCSGKKQR